MLIEVFVRFPLSFFHEGSSFTVESVVSVDTERNKKRCDMRWILEVDAKFLRFD
jgi:hypothetical protein